MAASRQQAAAASPFRDRRASLNTPVLETSAPGGILRKEQSSPAVIQHGDVQGSLVKQVVSASGQGCAAAVLAGNSTSHGGVQPRTATIWRTRSVRSKAESYCILHLKSCSNRGITVQVRQPCACAEMDAWCAGWP